MSPSGGERSATSIVVGKIPALKNLRLFSMGKVADRRSNRGNKFGRLTKGCIKAARRPPLVKMRGFQYQMLFSE
jgi:hypothetical protein